MPSQLAESMGKLDWSTLQQSLDRIGYAKLPPLLSTIDCREIIGTYDSQEQFRSTINMARYRFGIGEYKYYDAPLPSLLQELREGLYPELAKTANRWLEQLRREAEYPATLTEFLHACHEEKQTRSTPLILKYEAGGYNCLHQDIYGKVFFPFQVVFALSQQGEDYNGGEFLLVEQRPRARVKVMSSTLNKGKDSFSQPIIVLYLEHVVTIRTHSAMA
ncbi:hypothetical protein JCM16418_595 [Paenibacillus pini JCM 16418]|uniref:Fe2OG dioxygenase domain-containing protein n=1 Tax=Paenibacillus pini JCM 16418 TaxID=1236976 RepID=W7Y6T2_9BACL|nr:hypothetical protein JCM16418_595 [Paenibacillus pini JCM 16418]